MFAALFLKLGAALVRYYVAFGVYDGSADANRYHDAGALLAASYRHLHFVGPPRPIPGTGFVEVLTGALYTVTRPTVIGGFLVFAWLGFWGLYLFFRAFEMSVPDGLHRRYAILVFFLPSLLFWPSSIGKEAWMMFTLGVAAYGVARLLTHRRGGFFLLALGIGGTSLVRPHMSVVLVIGVIVGYILRRARRGASVFRPVLKVGGTLLLVGAATLLVSRAETFFKVETLDQTAVEQVLSETEAKTAQGGSVFEAQPVKSPQDFPQAFVTVMFRPFPMEADNAQMVIASGEGALLLLLFVLSWRRVLHAPLVMLQRAYVAFAATYTVAFVYAFSNIANFGILTRQRVQLFPLALVLLALPLPKPEEPELETDVAGEIDLDLAELEREGWRQAVGR